jgi:hypothetical protein
MPLTRNLYDLDEVISAAQVSFRKGWPRAIFWIWELIVSEEIQLAYRTLLDIWLMYGGGYDPELGAYPHPTNPTEWLTLMLRIQEAIRNAGDITAGRFLMETVGLKERPSKTLRRNTAPLDPTVCRAATTWVSQLDMDEELPSDIATNWFISLMYAIQNSTRKDAVWLLQIVQAQLSANGIWSALLMGVPAGTRERIIVESFQRSASPHPTQQILYQTAAVLCLCKPVADRDVMFAVVAPPHLPYSLKQWQTWDSVCGSRAARAYAIPTEALHRQTPRGALSKRFTNIDEIRDPLPLLLQGCVFWQRVCREAGITGITITGRLAYPCDAILESFVDRWFPDDIPDEWSLADQEKSHGKGCAETASLPPPIWIGIREEPLTEEELRSTAAGLL